MTSPPPPSKHSSRPSSKQWYAVHLRSNQERSTATFLEDRGVELFMPTYRVQSRRRDRDLVLSAPLFAGYIFVQLDLQSPDRIQVLKAPGVVRLVGFGDQATPIDDEVIDSLKILVGTGNEVRPHPLIKAGNQVEVTAGPFAGAIGKLHEAEGRPKLIVEIEFLGRAVAVEIDAQQVRPAFS